ncbi:hypothetical protein [Oxalobacter paraformigenes]|uniref:Uncharacterized protein n=1 Tax=Oxalobacter paraformigenes TaxID=556268 RepID=T5LT99_9BURK|nr:hypothetical protein [Oxalobacter paraformigenes]EQM95274.1 hypothetical protein OFAG_02168 [Oxalobacter paraformigenes]
MSLFSRLSLLAGKRAQAGAGRMGPTIFAGEKRRRGFAGDFVTAEKRNAMKWY